MKARIKSTGDIMPIAPYAKVTLDVCDDRGTPYEVDFEDVELINDDETKCDTDWASLRREAAKDILAGMMSNPEEISIQGKRLATIEGVVNAAIETTDELIRQLKEK